MLNKLLPDYCLPGRSLRDVAGVVIHHFSCRNVDPAKIYDLEACWRLFCDLNRPKDRREWYMKHDDRWSDERHYASAHVLIGRDGEVWKLAEFGMETWHAGRSILNGRTNCNKWTLGIELVGTATSGFQPGQYLALADLLNELVDQYGFGLVDIAGHDTVRHNARQEATGRPPPKKYDPSGSPDGKGDNFDWPMLFSLMGRRSGTKKPEAEASGR